VEKAVRLTLFLAVVFLASYLRITGLGWGLTSGYRQFQNFHPDEFVSLRGVRQIDLLAGRLKAPAAYFEGTFNYYLWAVPQAALNLLKKPEVRLGVSTSTGDHGDLLYLCRWMSVFFDLCTIVIVFLAIREATQDFYPSLLGALCYAVLPMQVIYAHFMRTHILSNLLCASVIWLSLKLCKSQPRPLLLTVGFLSGLGAATRYPAGILVVIPCLYLLFNGRDDLPNWKSRLWERARDFVAGPVWLIGLGFVVGLFLGHPMLFLDPSSVTKAITGETLTYASLQEFHASKLLNLLVIWKYTSYLIPFAMYPLLWVFPYCAILYLSFRRTLCRDSVPIVIFCLLYSYFMAKGYPGSAARPAMFLFPSFCVLVGVVCHDLRLRLRRQRIIAICMASVATVLIIPSILFDLAYVNAMCRQDARSVLRLDLQKLIGTSPVTIGVFNSGGYFFTVMPAIEPLKSKTVTIQLQDARQPADFFLVGFIRPIPAVLAQAAIGQIEGQGNFKYERIYGVRPKIFGRELHFERFPGDMTYPFPTILLFRPKPEAEG